MPAGQRSNPGSLGAIAFTALATRDSALYAPRTGATSAYVYGWATQAGTFQYFLRDAANNDVSLGAAASVAANTFDSAEIAVPIDNVFRVWARFVDTSGATGTAFFFGHDKTGA